MPSRPPLASIVLLAAMTAVYLVQIAMAYRAQAGFGEPSLVLAFEEAPEQLLARGAITPHLIAGREWSRALTAIFLHAGFLHLAYNAWALLQFGALLETLHGARALLASFFVSGVVASLASSMALEVEYAVGASGAIFGVVGTLLAVMRTIPARRPRVARMLQVQIALWTVATIASGFLSVAIDNTAHIAGCAAGLAFGGILNARRSAAARPRARG